MSTVYFCRRSEQSVSKVGVLIFNRKSRTKLIQVDSIQTHL